MTDDKHPVEPLTPEEEADVRAHWADVLTLAGSDIRRLLATLDAERARPDAGLREALARAIAGGYADASIDPDLYHNDPVFHAVVWEVRKHRTALAAPTEPTLDAAWAEAEAALPEGWRVGVLPQRLDDGARSYFVVALTPEHGQPMAYAEARSLPVALRALAARLASQVREQERSDD